MHFSIVTKSHEDPITAVWLRDRNPGRRGCSHHLIR